MTAAQLMETLRDIAHEQRRSMGTLRVVVLTDEGTSDRPANIKSVKFLDERGIIAITTVPREVEGD